MYFIYELVDPRTNVVAYVGITNNPNARLQEHISCTGPNDGKKTWVRELQEEGYEPRMKILEVVDTKKEALAREKYWMQYYTSSGISITNIRIPSCKMLLKLVWFPQMKMLLRESQHADRRTNDGE